MVRNTRFRIIRYVGEKRKLERFRLRLPAQMSYTRNGRRIALPETLTRDVSAAGAFLLAKDTALRVGTRVDVELVLTIGTIREVLGIDQEVRANVKGRVLRLEPDGVVVVFNDPFRFGHGPEQNASAGSELVLQ